jgi:hypothetical protein
MPLAVTCFCGYLCNRSQPWRPEDFDSYKWVHALKGHELNKHAYVPVRGQNKLLSNANLPQATEWFGMMSADYLKKKKLSGPFLVVPIPNSDNTVGSAAKPRTRKLAKAVCETLNNGSYMVDCLRWKKNLGSASKECGPREAGILYKNLVILEDPLEDVDEDYGGVLVDDVTTSGGHLQACAAKLESKGLTVCRVVCGGKTVYDQVHPAFHTYENELEEYTP